MNNLRNKYYFKKNKSYKNRYYFKKNKNYKNKDSDNKIILFMIVSIPKFLVYVIIFLIWFYFIPWVNLNTVWAHLDTAAMFAYNFTRILILKIKYYIRRFRSN